MFTKVSGCTGCGVCVAVCPVGVLDFALNEEGFYRPQLREGCIDCGLCRDCCAVLEPPAFGTPLRSWAMWASDEVRRGCSSGGAAFELARGRRFCGVRYNGGRAEHFVGSAKDARGSKYLQSYSPDGFREALREGGMIVGAPCQIASLRRVVGEDDKYLLVDFFCHGVPSKWLWDKYLGEHPELGEGVRWRDKRNGWNDSYRISGGDYFSPRDDMFFTFFLRGYVSMRECYDCPWRLENSAADVRVGDLWSANDELGVSAVVAMTARGERAVLAMRDVTLREQNVMRGRAGGKTRIPRLRERLLRELRGGRTLRGIYKKYELWLRTGRKL